MNTLEYFIEEVHSTIECSDERFPYVEVDVTINCWGAKERRKMTMSKTRWEQILKDGYFVE